MLLGLACRLPRILGVILTDKDGVTVAKCTLSVDDMILRVRQQSFHRLRSLHDALRRFKCLKMLLWCCRDGCRTLGDEIREKLFRTSEQ